MLTFFCLSILACPPTCGPSPLCAGDCFEPRTLLFPIADWNGDCELTTDDIVSFAQDVFSNEPCADLYCNGTTDADDLADFINFFFSCLDLPVPC